jgi:hypothetical protein
MKSSLLLRGSLRKEKILKDNLKFYSLLSQLGVQKLVFDWLKIMLLHQFEVYCIQ